MEYLSESTGRVLCSVASTYIFSSVISHFLKAVTAPACGYLVLSAPNKTVQCNGSSIYHATFAIGGFDAKNITEVQVSTTTDNVLVVDLLGAPYSYSFCERCYQQDYKAWYYEPNPKGNVIWRPKIWCGSTLVPHIDATVKGEVKCQAQ